MHYRVAKLLALIVGLEACSVMVGWGFGIDALTPIIAGEISMKFATALVFFFAAVGLYFVSRAAEGGDELSPVVLPGIALFILLLAGVLLASNLLGGTIGIENLFAEAQSPANATGSGIPSLFTVINFILFALASMSSLFPGPGRQKWIRFFGCLILVIGLIPIPGYLAHLPALYYQFNASAVPMAFSTALTFVLLGCGLLLVGFATTAHEA